MGPSDMIAESNERDECIMKLYDILREIGCQRK